MTEARGLDKAKQHLDAVLSEFRALLMAAKVRRAAVRPGGQLHDLALAAGRPVLGGFVPLLAAAERPAEQKRQAVSAGEGRFTAATPLAGPDQGAERRAGSLPSDTPLYRVTMAKARHEAAIARERLRAEREALRLPVPGRGVERMSFAPRGAAGVVEQERGHSSKGYSAPAPGLRRGRAVPGAAAMVESVPRDLSVAPESRHLDMQTVPEQQPAAPLDIRRALDDYFFRQSRLPPNGGAGFNPLLSPLWAGLKIPG